MKLLLDTQAFLWFALNDPQLSTVASAHILNPLHEKFVSPASFWEVAIKISTGKYTLLRPYKDFFRQGIDDNGFEILPVEIAHTDIVTALPFHHRDPFDRIIIAASISRNLEIVSIDQLNCIQKQIVYILILFETFEFQIVINQ